MNFANFTIVETRRATSVLMKRCLSPPLHVVEHQRVSVFFAGWCVVVLGHGAVQLWVMGVPFDGFIFSIRV